MTERCMRPIEVQQPPRNPQRVYTVALAGTWWKKDGRFDPRRLDQRHAHRVPCLPRRPVNHRLDCEGSNPYEMRRLVCWRDVVAASSPIKRVLLAVFLVLLIAW